MASLVRNYLLPGAASRRDRERAEQRRAMDMLEAEQARRRAQAIVDRELAAADQRAARPRRSPYRVVRAAMWRGRAALRPVYALGVLYAAGWMVWLSQPSPAAAILGFALVGVGWWRLRLTRRLDRNVERTYAIACLLGAWLWLCSCVAVAPAGREWQLLYPWIVAALIWWGPGRHWPSDWRPPVAAVDDPDDSLRARWDRNIAAPGRRLAGSRVLSTSLDEHGAEVMLVKLVPGQHTVETATLAVDQIASGLEEPDEQLIVEKAPVETNPKRNPTLLQVKVLPESPIKRIDWFEGPSFSDGQIHIGSYLDGIGQGAWTVYGRNGRMRGGTVFAGPGFGKSRFLDMKAVTMRSPEWQAQYPTIIVYLDGQNGASSPNLWKHASLHGGVDDADEILKGLLRAGKARQEWNTYYNLSGFFPGQSPEPGVPGLPGILVVVDEKHAIFNRGNVHGWTKVARELPKVGIAVEGADQVTDLSGYADSDALRSCMLAGNGLAMHIASRTAGNLVAGLPVDPYKLPAIPGYAVKFTTASSGERVAPLQLQYMPDRQSIEDGLIVPDHIRAVEDWYPLGREADMDDMTARALGPVWAERAQREALKRERLLAIIDGREVIVVDQPAADQVAPTEAGSQPMATVTPLRKYTRDEHIAMARASIAKARAELGMDADPAVAEYGRRVRDQFTPPAADRPSTYDVICDYLREHGQSTRKDIIAHVKNTIGTSESAIKQALQKLRDDGKATAEGGIYTWRHAA